jgi:hypothetical protein
VAGTGPRFTGYGSVTVPGWGTGEIAIIYTHYCPGGERGVGLIYGSGQAPSRAKCKLYQGDGRGVHSVPAIHYKGTGQTGTGHGISDLDEREKSP